ncbi:glutamine-rich protein 2 isoform X2 [Betta splendens]|uniref:Glutamine-rich protein 2 isoform X2 n=1 Tax=Betta splendens TaxID=158456 RepID=A0A6P7N7F0_BETSP|nr:glutamine-rich protein 2 isoform X2 [Betta splendens]
MSEENISLYELLNLAIGTPHEGAVNFSALHSLLFAVLRQLDLVEVRTGWRESAPGPRDLNVTGVTEAAEQPHIPTELDQEGHSDNELQKRKLTSPSPSPVPGGLLSRVQACEDGVSQVIKLIEDLHNQNENLKEEMKKQRKQLDSACEETITAVEKCCHRVDTLEETLTCVKDTFEKYPDPEKLFSNTENLQKELLDLRAACQGTAVQPIHDSNFTDANTSYVSVPSSTDSFKDSVRTASPTSPVNSGEKVMDIQLAREFSLVPSTQQTHLGTEQAAAGIPLSPESSGSLHNVETADSQKSIRKLKENFYKLETRLEALEEAKVEPTELVHLREFIANAGLQNVSNNLMDQLNQQKALLDGLMSDWEKLNSLLDIMKPRSQEGENSSGPTESVYSDSRELHDLRQQIFFLRRSVQTLEEDVKQMEIRQALSEERETHQHEQLDSLRGMLEDMMLSLNLEQSSSLEFEDQQDESDSEGPCRINERSAVEKIDRKLSCLFLCYEQLQDKVKCLVQQQTESRAGPLKITKNAELMNDVQSAINHLQAECEKLHETTRCLHEDNRQKQSHIEELYKTTEELEEKKADKQMVESEIKADKSVLESKVSRLQFDSATEQLNSMFHELLNKVTGQEQDWHKVIAKLSTEMECKLNRIELESVKKQLEDRWKRIHEKLQAQGAPEHEDAAGIRKQLVDRFHCLSCDRPVVKHTPGPHLVTLPSTPGFPSHKSIRPFTVYALEQFRQHYRSERIAELADYSHLAMSRSCGGSHTITSSSQRRSGLQYMKHHSQPEVDTVVQSEEVDIIGLDGHIYKGRLNPAAARNAETKLPTISTKEGMCKTKDKARASPSHKPAVSPECGCSPLVPHPHSARSVQCSRSLSSISGRDWPVSALGCASQSSITQTSAAGESNSEHLESQQVSL